MEFDEWDLAERAVGRRPARGEPARARRAADRDGRSERWASLVAERNRVGADMVASVGE